MHAKYNYNLIPSNTQPSRGEETKNWIMYVIDTQSWRLHFADVKSSGQQLKNEDSLRPP